MVPPITGVEKAVMAFDVFGHEEKLGRDVIVIGGGTVGCELSIHLSGLGHKVTIIEMGVYLASTAELTERMAIMVEMKKCKVESLTETVCTQIADGGVYIENQDGRRFVGADSVVISVGTRALSRERDKFIGTAFDVINVGDCVKASNIANATETGWNAGAIL